MAWWNSSWTRKKVITLTGGASGAQSNFQTLLTVTWDSDMKSDFSDLRFTNGSESALIDSWMESHTASTSAKIWVEFPTTPANTVEQDYYMYYGNGSAASDWDGAATWIDFQNLDGQGTGEVGTGWTDWIGTPRTSNAQSHSSSISLEFVGNEGAYRSLTQINNDNDRRIMFFVRKQTSTGELAVFLGDGQYYDIHTSIRDAGGIDLEYYTTGWNDTGHNATLAAWKKMEFNNIDFTNDQLDWYYDGVLVKENLPFRVASDHIDYIRIHNSDGTSYFDDLCVGKYASGPPTYAFGSEESAPTAAIPVMMRYYRNLRL